MQVQIGKGIELEVNTAKLPQNVLDHVIYTGLRNVLMDSHASATAKADPEGYIVKSRELAEKKLASLYAGIARVQSVGGPKAPTDPVGAVILRLARKAVQRDRGADIAAAAKTERLALINRLASAYAAEHDAQLRPRAEKIVTLETLEDEPAKKTEAPRKRKAA
jgi:hypothetical protein